MIETRRVHEFEFDAHKVIVIEAQGIGWRVDAFFVGERLHHIFEFAVVAQPHGVQHEIAHIAVLGKHEHDFVVILGPFSGDDVVLLFDHGCVLGQLVEDIRAHHGRHDSVACR